MILNGKKNKKKSVFAQKTSLNLKVDEISESIKSEFTICKSYNIFLLSCLFVITIFFSRTSLAENSDAYFQQYVNYDINVKLDVDYHKLDVKETLLYTNNSPDTLKEIYFYVYMNKFRKKSLALPQLFQDKGSITIHQVLENDSANINGLVDETIFHVKLHNILFPGYSVRFKFEFTADLPQVEGRLGYFGEHYDIGNWYITPAVYDKQGWHLNQHLDNEFYQEWGDFKVDIRVPKGFLVGATGNLMNLTEAYADTGYYIPNYYLVGEEDTTNSHWIFEAKNVHDFAWTTDPDYRLLQAQWNGITFNVLVFSYNTESWKQVLDWGLKTIQFLSENFGDYPYDQMTVADTYIKAGGIEYPQITFINDMIHPEYQLADFRTTIIHEMAHNWFYGILGNNQTEKGWMDEGFTTFAEIKTVESLFGRYTNYPVTEQDFFTQKFSLADDDRSINARSYLKLAKFEFDNDFVNLHPDYMGREAYILEYDKSAMILFMLEYTLGDSVFKKAMLDYYDKWKFKHPGPEDFISSIEQTSGRELDWFFEQWINTNRKLDYAITDVDGEWQTVDSLKTFHCQIDFERKNKIFMPIDFDVYLENGDTLKYQIPVDRFSKPEKNRKVLPYWHFSQKKYSAKINCKSEVDKVEIDPSLRLMDINMLDNISSCIPKQDFHFMKYASNKPPVNKYLWEMWPTAFYNDIDKLKFGINLNGSYLDIDHKLDLWLWYKTAKTNFDFDFSYRTPVDWLGKLTHIYLNAFTIDGRQGGQVSIAHLLDKVWREEPRYKIEAGFTYHKNYDISYLMSAWDKGDITTLFFNWSLENSYYRGWKPKNILQVNLITSFLTPHYDFSLLSLEWQHKLWKTGNDWEIDFRLFGGHIEGNAPLQYMFNLSGDNGWGEFQQSFYCSKGSLPFPWKREGHLYKQGGGNIRGYSLINPENELISSNVASINIDISLPNPLNQFYIPIVDDIYPVMFTDIGTIWNSNFPSAKSFKKSFGGSLVWNSHYYLDYLFNLEKVRIDFPIWLSDVPDSKKNLEFRWLIRFDFRY